MCDLIIANYIGLHHTLLHLLLLINTWHLLQHNMYLSTQQQAHPLEFFALQMGLAIICHIHCV